MIGLLINILYAAIAAVIAVIFGAVQWTKRTFQSISVDKRNIIKLITVPLIYYFLFTRVLGVYELLIKEDHQVFREADMTPRREVKVDRYLRLQEKTYFLDKYRNLIDFFKKDDRPGLGVGVYMMTYSRRFEKYSEIVWDRHCAKLIKDDDPEKVKNYLKEQVKWMSDKEKTARINRIKSQINNKNKES